MASSSAFSPINALVTPLLTDKYQLTMAYAHWRNKRHETPAVFDLFFRKAPFDGELTIFGGLEEALRFVASFRFSPRELAFVREQLHADDEFIDYLAQLDARAVKIYACDEGSAVYPRVPLMRIEGPLVICQLLETTLLVLVNYATLMATNAARHRLAAGRARIVEFGLRRAQGPDGGISAARYAFLGGAHGTSNMTAARLLGIPASGTHAHAFVTAFTGEEDVSVRTLKNKNTGDEVDFVDLALECRTELGFDRSNVHELYAFIAYALAFPDGFLALVDTYDTLESGVPNFLAVATALHLCGRRAVGIRLDSGDLAYLSRSAREQFKSVATLRGDQYEYFERFTIVASNNINEPTLRSLAEQGHSIDVFGIGTHLVTCQAQPALGAVYKLVQIDGKPRIKLSDDVSKANIPGRHQAYRLYGPKYPLVDLLCSVGNKPEVGKRVLCVHPFIGHKRAYVTPQKVERLLHLYWCGADCKATDEELEDAARSPIVEPSTAEFEAVIGNEDVEQAPPDNKSGPLRKSSEPPPVERDYSVLPSVESGRVTRRLPSLRELRAFSMAQVAAQRIDHTRALNPTPYKVSVTQELHDRIRSLVMDEAPIIELN